MLKVGIIGTTGLVGETLLSLLLHHKEVELTLLTSEHAGGRKVGEVMPRFGDVDLLLQPTDIEEIKRRCDVVFITKPHGESMDMAKELLPAGIKVIDSGADFRLKKAEEFRKWYGIEHSAPDLLSKSVYGLPELHREEIEKTNLVAVPGCYPTAVILGCAPLAKAGLLAGEVIANCYSGVSGAGRTYNPRVGNLFIDCYENLKPYNVLAHRHTPEMEQELSLLSGEGVRVLFIPHLAPIERGILATLYLRLRERVKEDRALELYREFYASAPFVRILSTPPSTKLVRGTNFCDIFVKTEGQWAIVFSAIDNLLKGAAGQSVECFNLMNGFPWEEGLSFEEVKA